MKYKNVKEISAIGTKGKAKGKKFIAKPDSNGKYVLNKKVTAPSDRVRTNMAVNKVFACDMTDAANLLATNEYLINLVCDSGSRALREYSKITIIES